MNRSLETKTLGLNPILASVSSAAKMPAAITQPPKAGRAASISQIIPARLRLAFKSWGWFLGLALIFLWVEHFVPLGTAIKLGADEDYELSKTLLFLKGFQFYSEVWVDQPPLYTYLLAQIVGHTGMAVLGARLLSVGLALLLLASLFRLALHFGNPRTAVLSVALLITAPGFLELSSSCMVEIPTLSFVVATFALLTWPSRSCTPWLEIGAGIVFGIALQMKLIALVYFPLMVFMLWLKHHLSLKRLIFSAFVLGCTAVGAFLLLNLMTGCSLTLQIQQSWSSHFASAKSFEYGSPNDHTFDPALLLRNWDVVVPAFLFAGLALSKIRSVSPQWFPLAWLALSLGIVSTHRPWWACYYMHNAIPLCWCAAIALDNSLNWATSNRWRIALVAVYLLAAATWMGTRSYLELMTMRNSPKLYNSLVLSRIERYKPYTRYMFTDEEVYSYHAGIPLPPQLAEISLKRLWSGDMTNEKMAADLADVKPGLILVDNRSGELPYSDLIQRDYRMVYQDEQHRLYALKSISRLPVPQTLERGH